MKKLRTKIILIFLTIVILPLFPIAWLVNGLVYQSYQVGVNPQVEQALQKGVEFSRRLYQMRKIHLAEILARQISPAKLQAILSGGAAGAADIGLPADNEEWEFLFLQIYDADGNLVARQSRAQATPVVLDAGHFAQLEETSGHKLVIANRRENRFVAIEKRSLGGETSYVALAAAMKGDFLADTDQTLRVFQLYRTLSISPVSIPQSFLYSFLLVSMVILLVVMGIGIWISRRITRPLNELVKGTQEIGRGNLQYRIPRQTRDEIGQLVDRFNRMAGELNEFQQKTIYLEKMAAWQEIARRLAHEIKNPLTPIQLTVQEMVDQYAGGEPEYAHLLHECHGIINEEIENLRRLVREFSDFGRLPELKFRPVDLHGLLEDIRRLYPHREIHLQLAEARPVLEIDEDRIRRVLINLIENACQADPDGHPLVIRTHPGRERVEISIIDQGSGIAPDLQDKIFQPYFSTKTNGIGLGLAITRKMVEEHEGEIWVESQPGKGSTFTFALPVKKSDRGSTINDKAEEAGI